MVELYRDSQMRNKKGRFEHRSGVRLVVNSRQTKAADSGPAAEG